MRSNKKRILLMIFILLFVFSGITMAFNLKIEIEDNMLLSEAEKKVSLLLEDESGEIIKDDRELMLRIKRGGVLENEYLNNGIKLKNGQAEFTYLAPKKLGRAEIVIIDTQTNKSIKKPLIIVNKKELQHHSQSGYATITDFSGEVLVKSGGNDTWESAVVGQKLHKDDFIKTQFNSWSTLSLFDGSEITIEPSTEFQIVNLTGDISNEKLDQGVFKLIMGTVLNKINELTGRGSRFEIETDSATAGVRGTYFEVSYNNGKNKVRVYEGSVRTEAKSTEKVYVINEQEEITVDQKEESSDSEAGIPNQIKKHNVTQAEKFKEIEEKKAEIKEKVEENKANSNMNNKGSENSNSNANNGKSVENKGKGNNSENSNSGKSVKNKGNENSNSGANDNSSSNNSKSESNENSENNSDSSSNNNSENNSNSGGESNNSSSNSSNGNNNGSENNDSSANNSNNINNNSTNNSNQDINKGKSNNSSSNKGKN